MCLALGMKRSVRDAILDALGELPPETSLSVEELAAAVDKRLQRTPGKVSDVRARLVQLRQEGIVARLERGQYRLPRTDRDLTSLERRLADLLRQTWRPEALSRLVLWDATPYLDLGEDGAPGQRVVIEHPKAAELRDAIAYAWDAPPTTWTARGRGPLDDRLFGPDRPVSRIDVGVILVEQERLGGTALVPDGFRVPTTERIATEFMGLDSRPDVGAAVTQALLLRSELDYKRLWQAANALGNRTELVTILTACYDRLPEGLQDDYRKRLPRVAAMLMGVES